MRSQPIITKLFQRLQQPGRGVSTVRILPVQGIGSRAPERATSSAPLRIAAKLLELGLCGSRVLTTYVGGSARVRWFSGMSEAPQRAPARERLFNSPVEKATTRRQGGV